MKKLLLALLALGATQFSQAQFEEGYFDVDGMNSPSGTITSGDSGLLEVTVTNTDTLDYPAGTQYVFIVTYDNQIIVDNSGNNFTITQTIPFTPNDQFTFLLSNQFVLEANSETTADLCVQLASALVGTTIYMNMETDATHCSSITVNPAQPSAVNEKPVTAENVYYANGMVNFNFGAANFGQVELNIMNMTGQAVQRDLISATGLQQVATNDIPAGLYIATWKTESGQVSSQKFYIQ